jgi:hypothetical protein
MPSLCDSGTVRDCVAVYATGLDDSHSRITSLHGKTSDTAGVSRRNVESRSAMTNPEFIQCFENDALPGEFHHADHVRLAYAYLSQYSVLRALERFASALKRYADARGKSQLYHETVTHAYFFLIRERMARTEAKDWDEFAQRNPDLLVWKNGILTRYYQQGTLESDLARTVFLFPDKVP